MAAARARAAVKPARVLAQDRLLFVATHHKAMTTYFHAVLKALALAYDIPFEKVANADLPRPETRMFLSMQGKQDLAQIGPYRGVHVMRDPRDMIVSGYHYHKWTHESWVHRLDEAGESYQQKLNRLDKTEGLFLEIDHFIFFYRDALTAWDLDDPDLFEVSYEALMGPDKRAKYGEIFTHLGFRDAELALATDLMQALRGREPVGQGQRGDQPEIPCAQRQIRPVGGRAGTRPSGLYRPGTGLGAAQVRLYLTLPRPVLAAARGSLPMPFFRTAGQIVYFAHVPKCAGTSVEDYLIARFGPLAMLDRRFLAAPPETRWSRTSPQHVDWQSLQTILPATMIDAVFTVVRHPVARAESAFHFQIGVERSIPPETRFSDWLREQIAMMRADPFVLDGHMRPQTDFVPEGAAVFHMEHGLDALIPWLDAVAGNSRRAARHRPFQQAQRSGPGPGQAGAPARAKPDPEDITLHRRGLCGGFRPLRLRGRRTRAAKAAAPALPEAFAAARDRDLARRNSLPAKLRAKAGRWLARG